MEGYIKSGKRVGRKGLDIDNNQIKDLYINQGLTIKVIGEQLGISHWTVLSRLKKMDIRKNTRHEIKNPYVFNAFTAESCYWAGFIAADACAREKTPCVDLELKEEDADHLTNLCGFVGRDNKLWKREKTVDGKIYKASVLSLNSKHIKHALNKNFNIIPRKSKTLKPPTIPTEHLHHFIRGYIDGDGSIGWHKHNNKPRLSICSGSKEFLEWLVDHIKAQVNTGNPSIREESNRNLYTIEFMGKQVYGILDWLYQDSTPETRLARKFEKYLTFKQNTLP